MSQPSKIRDSNLELFRCIVMLMIVAHHFVFHSGLMDLMSESQTSFKSLYLYLFGAWGKVGINCFVLITGYFMCKSNITIRKFLKLLFQIEFYKIAIYLIFAFAGYESFSFANFLESISPIVYISDDFVSCFLLFYLFIPFLNVIVRNVNRRQHGLLILLCLSIFSVLPLVPYVEISSNYIVWFCVLFFISSYIRLYNVESICKCWGMLSILSVIVAVFSILFFISQGMRWPYYLVYDSNKLLALAVSISSFLFFKNIKMRYSRIINAIGSTTFGILLIHDCGWTMRTWLWQDVINPKFWYTGNVYLYSIASVCCVFAICSFLDIVRQYLFEKPLFQLLDLYLGNCQCLKNVDLKWN